MKKYTILAAALFAAIAAGACEKKEQTPAPASNTPSTPAAPSSETAPAEQTTPAQSGEAEQK